MKQTMERQQQRDDALAKANSVRLAQATLRRELRDLDRVDGERELADLIRCSNEDHVLRAKVGYLMASVQRRGHAWYRRILGGLGISPQRKVRDLTDRERRVIAHAIERGGIERSENGFATEAVAA